MSKLSVILQLCNDNLVHQMLLWYFWVSSGHSFDESVTSVGRDSENSLKIMIVPLKSRLLATMMVTYC